MCWRDCRVSLWYLEDLLVFLARVRGRAKTQKGAKRPYKQESGVPAEMAEE